MTDAEKLADELAGISGRCSLERDRETIIKAATALRASAAVATGGEPVAWLYEAGDDRHWGKNFSFTKPAGNQYQRNIQPLYTALPPAKAAGDVRAAVIEALRPFALNPGAISLSAALGHIGREHLLAAKAALDALAQAPATDAAGGRS